MIGPTTPGIAKFVGVGAGADDEELFEEPKAKAEALNNEEDTQNRKELKN